MFMHNFRKIRFACLLLGLMLSTPVWADSSRWILVDSASHTLTVLTTNNRVLARFDNISLGRGGVAPVHYRGDDTTPQGEFRIWQIRPSAQFGMFYELDYPTPAHAKLAWQAGKIDQPTFDSITQANLNHQPPRRDTALGSEIGIHGLGHGNAIIHKQYDWTSGCVALTNSQLRHLTRWVKPGMRVVIR